MAMAIHPIAKAKGLPLKDANPEGRLDVVAYKVAEKLIGRLEEKTGLKLWDAANGYVEEIIGEVLPASRIQLPTEVAMIIDVLRKNGMNI